PIVFSHRLDDGSFSVFTSTTSVTLTGLTFGPHTFELRARDALGNVDPTPAVRHFIVADRSFSLFVATDRAEYDRGQAVEVTGNAIHNDGTALAQFPVTLVVTSRGFTREFSVITNAEGNFQF